MKPAYAADPALLKMFGWFLLLAALPYAWFAFSRAYTKIDSYTWPTALAEVQSSSMYQRTGKRTDWCVKVSYRYRVQDRFYTAHRPGVSMLGDAGCDVDRAVIQRWLLTLAPGNAVQAYYNPHDPSSSAIRLVGLDAADYAFCVTSVLFFSVGLLTLRHVKNLKST